MATLAILLAAYLAFFETVQKTRLDRDILQPDCAPSARDLLHAGPVLAGALLSSPKITADYFTACRVLNRSTSLSAGCATSTASPPGPATPARARFAALPDLRKVSSSAQLPNT